MTRSNKDGDGQQPHPKVPRDAIVNSDGRPPDTDASTPTDIEALFDDPQALDAHISETALSMVTLTGPVAAETVVDLTPTGVTLGATYSPDATDDHIGNINALASDAACVTTAGTQKVDGRYVPERLEFETTFSFTNEVASLRDLQQEWKELFGVKLAIAGDESESDSAGFNPV